MSKLTLDEAIKHCLEVAEQNDTQAEKWQEEGGKEWGKTTACRECAADHRQLAEWLTELKEAKRLLKATINDIYKECSCNTCGCDICEYNRETCDYDDRFTWRHKAAVLKLIGEDDNESQN